MYRTNRHRESELAEQRQREREKYRERERCIRMDRHRGREFQKYGPEIKKMLSRRAEKNNQMTSFNNDEFAL